MSNDKKTMSVCLGQQRREDAGSVGIQGTIRGGEGVSQSGRCPAAVTQCKLPIKAGLNPLSLSPAGSVMGDPFVEGPSRWYKEHFYASKAPAKYSWRGA